MRYLRVKNWDQFQHYRDRAPPWIKLHNSILEDYDFTCLPDASKAHLIAIWLLASRSDNRIPADPKWIQSRIGAKSAINLALLVRSGFLEEIQPLPLTEQDASNVLAKCYREGETEAEAEREAEAEQSREVHAPSRARPGNGALTSPTWNAYAAAYAERYGAEPVRNAKINAQLKQLTERIPRDDCPDLASWFVGHQGKWYVSKGHSIACLLTDCEQLHTQWRTGIQITDAQARQMDGTANRGQIFEKLIAEARERAKGGGS